MTSEFQCAACGADWDAEHEAGRCPLPDVLACPFCADEGALVVISHAENDEGKELAGFAAHCDVCGARGPTKPSREDAIAAWNLCGRSDATA